jgi:segregation and condensation protein B
MLTDDILKALVEGIIYVAPEPVTLDGILKVLEGEERERVQAKLEELMADYEQNSHGIQIRQVANGYKFSTKVEHHEILRKYVKSLKPLVRLSKPALETLAVIAYRQPVTMPEIEEIRGVDSGGVIHTLLEKKLVVTAGRKSVVGRPILYRTSKDFLVHFGLKDVGELPSLKEFEELAKRALGSEWATGEPPAETSGTALSNGSLGVPAQAETGAQSPTATPVALGEEAAPIEDPCTTGTASAAEEPGAVNTDGTPAILPESPAPLDEDAAPVENPPATETATVGEVPAPVNIEPAPENPPEVSLPTAEAAPPPEDSVSTGAAPAATEETDAVDAETSSVSPQESVGPAADEAPSAEDNVTAVPPEDSSEPDRPAQGADLSTPTVTEATSARGATPEDDEPKP